MRGSHAYLTPGHHTVTVTIKDEGGSTATATSKAVVGNDHERLVGKVFEELLERAVDAASLKFFVGLLDGGMTASSVVAQIEQSTEFLAGEVQTLFQQLLHRAAEASAVTYFSYFLSVGESLTTVEQFISESPEYFQVRGTGGTPF